MASGEAKEEVPLSQAAEYLLEECRMVLPGIQALFGFQLIAVFSNGFGEHLSAGEQRLHLAAITLAAIAIALIMTPAAYHRHRGTHEVTETFIRISTRVLLWSMVPLAAAIGIDLYIVARVIAGASVAAAIAAITVVVYLVLWGVLP